MAAYDTQTCRKCFFWKDRKIGFILGRQNFYYLAEPVMTAQEKKYSGCCVSSFPGHMLQVSVG